MAKVIVFVSLASFLASQSAGPAFAASWYVDKDAAGSNNGTSWANAWRNFSSVAWGASGVKAGDTLYISGGTNGKTYSETLYVGASGVSGNPIHIRPGQDGGHSGQVIWDYDYLGDSGSGSAIILSGRNFITVDGGGNGQRNIVVRNLRNILNGFKGVAILAESTTGVILRDLELTNVNIAVWIAYSAQYEIVGNRMRARGDSVINANVTSGTWSENRIHHNQIEQLWNMAVPPGGSGLYVGPDGIQTDGDVSIFNNTFRVTRTSVYTSDQHPDSIQLIGDNTRIYNNEFINVGDSSIDRGLWADQSPNDIWIYNNVFRIEEELDSYPEYIRLYAGSGGGKLLSMNNFKVLNNLFIDNMHNYYPIVLQAFYNSGATGGGNEIKNNIFYNIGTASYPVIYIENAPSLQFEFDRNVYCNSGSAPHINYRGTDYSMANWMKSFEAGARTNFPQFVSYIHLAANNDLHLRSTDTVAKDAGLDLGSLFSADKDGLMRPQGAAWDIGPYEYGFGSGANQPPVVNAGSDLDVYLPNDSAMLMGSAADPEGRPLTLTWSQVSGPGTVSFASPGSAVTLVSFPTNLGTYLLRLSASDGTNSASSDVRLKVNGPMVQPVARIEAESGTISGPFTAVGGAVSQSVETGLSTGGRAVYQFSVPTNGNYSLRAWVNAPGAAANSFYVNIDGEPTDPYMIWDVSPITSGYETRSVAWRGNGTFDANEFNPKIFRLSAGQHSLVIIGREAGILLDRLEIIGVDTAPAAPTNLRLVNGVISWSAGPGSRYQVECKTNLNQGFWQVLGNVTATNATVTFRDPRGPLPQCFYRVVSM